VIKRGLSAVPAGATVDVVTGFGREPEGGEATGGERGAEAALFSLPWGDAKVLRPPRRVFLCSEVVAATNANKESDTARTAHQCGRIRADGAPVGLLLVLSPSTR
jgi:hypothetical protein